MVYKVAICYIKQKQNNREMQKNRGDDYESIQVDPITGEYYIVIPEWMVSELSWYEDTEIRFSLEGDEIVLKEKGYD